MKILIIASAGGSVSSKVVPLLLRAGHQVEMVSDRRSGSIDVAARLGIPSRVLPATTGREFSDLLMANYPKGIDLYLSFYTRLFSETFVARADGRLLNLHPSILPACPGRHGFEDTVRSKSQFIGSTIHFVDNGIDTGAPFIQAARPFDPGKSLVENRHVVFVQQCKMVLQAVRWMAAGRVSRDASGRAVVAGARYDPGEFAPNLDDPEAMSFVA